jgi:hypothetical protein
MDKCILCSSELIGDKRRGDCDRNGQYYFDEIPHLECNINIIATQRATYVEVSNNKGYNNTWHIDNFGMPDGEFKKFLESAPTFTNKLKENIKEALQEIG